MRTPEYELKLLRMSVARAAQALGFDSTELPGRPPGYELEHLLKSVEEVRGWNALGTKIVDRIEEIKGDLANSE